MQGPTPCRDLGWMLGRTVKSLVRRRPAGLFAYSATPSLPAVGSSAVEDMARAMKRLRPQGHSAGRTAPPPRKP